MAGTGRMTKVTHVPKSAWTMLPPASHVCQTCAVDHESNQPHDPHSFFWQTARNVADLGPPTWELALAHCSEDVRDRWIEGLGKRDVAVDVAEVERLAAEQKHNPRSREAPHDEQASDA